MDKKCNIIRDLLPLYHERLTSDESNQFIKTHLESCKDCSEYLLELNDEDGVTEESTNMINKIRQTIIVNKRKSVIISILITIVLVVLFVFAITAPEYIQYDENEVSVSKLSNSDYVLLILDNNATNYEISIIGNNIYSVTTWTSILDQVLNKKPVSSIIINSELEQVDSVVYSEYNSTESIEIYGHQYENGGVVILPRLVIGMYLILAVISTIILFALKMITKKWPNINKFFTIVLSFTLAYIISTILVKGFSSTSSYSPIRDISQILILSIIIEIIYLKVSEWRKETKKYMIEK
jgi:hypothetical protein